MPVSAQYSNYLVQQLTVLLVDDNTFMRKIVRGMLNTIGVRIVVEASDGAEAMEMIRNAPPDVVILDWEMPVVSGPEVVRAVRSSGTFPKPDVPIIMLTGHADADRLKMAVALGVNDFLCKPVSVKALQDRLTMVVNKPLKGAKPVAPVPA